MKITITATRQSNDECTEIRLEVNDIEVGRAEIKKVDASRWRNLKCYVSSPWHDSVNGKISKILMENL